MKDNHTIIIVDNDDSSFKVSENIIIFNDGTAIKSGTPEDFKNKNTYAKYL
jgi:ABC-type proline/glycine betaine transport system ATPase subunit